MKNEPTGDESPVINSPKEAPDWSLWKGEKAAAVVKIVIGPSPGESDAEPIAARLPSDLAEHFKNLTHLYLWNISDLTTLPELPEGLQCLDLRGCDKLTSLPKLPTTLHTIDLGGCSGLTEFQTDSLPQLRWLHIDDCSQVEESDFNVFLKGCRELEELTLRNCTQFHTLRLPIQPDGPPEARPGEGLVHPRFPARRLKKLVVTNCNGLSALPELSRYPWLHHLNVNGCSALDRMPSLPVAEEMGNPTGIRTLYTHGCPKLREFRGLDLRPVHLSTSEDENVADGFRTMTRLSESPVDYVMAKALFLGSGRCGKTTLSKSLEWVAMNDAERAAHPEKNPALPQSSTERIRFAPLASDFHLPPGGRVPTLRGTLHLWDFGGQEVYHNTHRLFASQGSIFVIVTTSHETHRERLEAELAGVAANERDALREQNEYREIKYWLDYIRNALRLTSIEDLARGAGKVSMVVIHTGPGSVDDARKYLLAQAGAYGELFKRGDIQILAMDLHAVDFDRPAGGFAEFQTWVRRAAGRAADQFGIRVPSPFASVATLCEELAADESPENQMLDWGAWESRVRLHVSPIVPGMRPQAEAAWAIARYLHHCGRVFCISSGGQYRKVIIDQQWAVELIYLVTVHAVVDSRVRDDLMKLTASLFSEDEFRRLLKRKPEIFRPAVDDVLWPVLLEMLDQCDVCVRVGDKLMATQRELLREKGPRLEEELAREWMSVSRNSARPMVNHSFAIHGDQGGLLGASDYRAVLAFIARGIDRELADRLHGDDEERADGRLSGLRDFTVEYREDAAPRTWFWRNGFMVRLSRRRMDADPITLMLRIEWIHRMDPAAELKRLFEGGLFVQFLTPDEETYSKRLMAALFEGDGPLSFFKDNKTVHDHRAPDLAAAVLPMLRGFGQPGWGRMVDGPPRPGLRFEVAISYRSTETALVTRLADALIAEGFSVYHYAEDQRLRHADETGERPGGSFITDIYEYLKTARVLLVIPSKSYFDDPTTGRNRYCPVELAEAILAHARNGGSRRGNCFFWAAGDGALSPSQIEGSLKNVLQAHYEQVIKPRMESSPVVAVITQIEKRENDSMGSCNAVCVENFLNDVGRNSKQYIAVTKAGSGGELSVDELIARIRTALASC